MTQNYFFGLPDDLINKIVNQNQESLEDKINELIPSLDKIDNFKQLTRLVANVYNNLQKNIVEMILFVSIIRSIIIMNILLYMLLRRTVLNVNY